MKQERYKDGKYAPKGTRASNFTLFSLVFFVCAVIFAGYTWDFIGAMHFTPEMVYDVKEKIRVIEVDKSDEKLGEKIELLKEEVIDTLIECESGNREGLVIFDSNRLASIGAAQFQQDTIKRYVSKFYGEKITDKETILIAIGEHDIHYRELTKRIIFDDDYEQIKKGIGGIWNWRNCANKTSLVDDITFIRKLEEL